MAVTTQFSRHFYVLVDLALCLLNPSIIAQNCFFVFEFTKRHCLYLQLFKGKFYSCHDVPSTLEVKNKSHCLSNSGNWVNNQYNFDHLAHVSKSISVLEVQLGLVYNWSSLLQVVNRLAASCELHAGLMQVVSSTCKSVNIKLQQVLSSLAPRIKHKTPRIKR